MWVLVATGAWPRRTGAWPMTAGAVRIGAGAAKTGAGSGAGASSGPAGANRWPALALDTAATSTVRATKYDCSGGVAAGQLVVCCWTGPLLACCWPAPRLAARRADWAPGTYVHLGCFLVLFECLAARADSGEVRAESFGCCRADLVLVAARVRLVAGRAGRGP